MNMQQPLKGKALAQKFIRASLFWPTLQANTITIVQRCDKCQRFASMIGPLIEKDDAYQFPISIHVARDRHPRAVPPWKETTKFWIVAIDYFTKWEEAKLLAKITNTNAKKFIWKNIICRFGLSRIIITDNSKQFDNKSFLDFCSKLGIENQYSSLHYLQANG